MEHILRKHPFDKKLKPNTDKATTLLKMMRWKKPLNEIEAVLKFTRSEETLSHYLDCIKSGCPITRENLSDYFGIDEGFFDFIKSHIDPTADINDISLLRAKCHETTKVSDDMIKLVLHFVRVRDHLNSLMLPYYDPADSKLVKANLLLKKPSSTITKPSGSIAAEPLNESITEIIDDYDDSYDAYLGSLGDQFDAPSGWGSQNGATQPKINLTQFEMKNSDALDKVKMESLSSTSSAKAISVKNEMIAVSKFQFKQKSQINSGSVITEPVQAAKSDNLKVVADDANATKVTNGTTAAVTKPTIKPKSQVIYCSDSDEDEKSVPQPVKRTMPGWLSKSTSAPKSVPKRKRIF